MRYFASVVVVLFILFFTSLFETLQKWTEMPLQSGIALLNPAAVAGEAEPARNSSAADQTRPVGIYDARNGYLITWLSGSNYAGYGGTDQVIGRLSSSRPND